MTGTTRPDTPYDGPERRKHPRIPASVVPHLRAHVAGGPAVRLIDLSKRGVLLEAPVAMALGATVTIRFVMGDHTETLYGAVVRSAVAVIETSGEVTYHTALAFTDELTLCGEEFDAATFPYRNPSPEVANDYTMIVVDGRTGTLLGPGEASAW